MPDKFSGNISDDTPLLPWLIAQTVLDELTAWLQQEHHVFLPDGVPPNHNLDMAVEHLVTKADHCYRNNAEFRRLLQSPGSRGRDQCYASMRHFLVGYAKDYWPAIYELTPRAYRVGAELPRKRIK